MQKGTHQERNHRGGRADTKRLHRHKKGEVYESHLFTVKDDKFKSEPFLREVKEVYTNLIYRHISDPEQQLKVFDKNSVYLPTKKIGKNNPKAAEIEADNTARQEWNRTADMPPKPTLDIDMAEFRHMRNLMIKVQDKAVKICRIKFCRS